MLKTYTIDASKKILGRLATQVAFILQGKDTPSYAPNKIGSNKVVIFNAEKIVLTGKKAQSKIYQTYSGYPGGVKTTSFEELMIKAPIEPIKRAIYDMLPKNKLRNKFMSNLKIYAGEIKEN